MASVRSIDDALGITLTPNGRIMRNIIHGADTVMSHILHFYHLAAVDFIDASALGSPWAPAFSTLSNAALLPPTAVNLANECIVLNYVEALNIRRDAHTLGAIFSGRHPIQNAIVPGGVATIVTQTDINQAQAIIDKIRNFINQKYIPDVVTAATITTAPYNFHAYWTVGTNPYNLLSYGEYPFLDTTFKNCTDNLLLRGVATGLTPNAFDPANIRERVLYSHYDDGTDNLHPSAGVTSVDLTKKDTGASYSWLKAPRYNGSAYEVGPLARVLVTYLAECVTPGSTHSVSENGSDPLLGGALTSPYTLMDLVDAAVLTVISRIGAAVPGFGYGNLYSPLGRHAARALECKFIADAIGGGIDAAASGSWLSSLSLVAATNGGNNVAYGYTYVAIPKATVQGTGLAEAPRGALGHWITIQSKKIGNYQCIVPSTWNCCPKGANPTDRGPAEAALIGLPACAGDPSASAGLLGDAVLNISRMLHPYDFCIACAVHLVTPEGKEIAKFKMDTDGKVTRE